LRTVFITTNDALFAKNNIFDTFCGWICQSRIWWAFGSMFGSY